MPISETDHSRVVYRIENWKGEGHLRKKISKDVFAKARQSHKTMTQAHLDVGIQELELCAYKSYDDLLKYNGPLLEELEKEGFYVQEYILTGQARVGKDQVVFTKEQIVERKIL